MFRNLIRSLITKGCVALINFLLLIASARYLGVSSRGEISIFILNLTLIQIINEAYTGYTLIHFIPRFNLSRLFLSGLVYTLIFCSLSNLLIAFTHRQVEGFEWLGYVVSLLVILNTFNCVIILGKGRMNTYNFLSLLQPLTLLVGFGFFVFVMKDFTFRAYVYPLLISFLLAIAISSSCVLNFVFENKESKVFQLKPVLVNGFLSQAGILTYVFCNRFSYYLLSNRAEVGLYASAVALTESVLVIMNGIMPVMLARIAQQGNSEKNGELALGLSKFSFLFSFVVLFMFFLLPEGFFIFLLGKGFLGIKLLMLLYAPGVLLASAFGIVSGYFSAIGKPGLVLLYNGFGGSPSLLLGPWLVHRFHTVGAAYIGDLACLTIALSAFFFFFKWNKFPLQRLFTISKDYAYLKQLLLEEKSRD